MKKFVKLLFSRLVIVAFLILLQACVIIGVFLKLSNYFIYIHYLFVIISVIIVIYLINKNEEPSFKIPWILLILIFPILGGLLYVMFGNNKMNKKIERIAKTISPEVMNSYHQTLHPEEKVIKKLEQQNKIMYRQSHYITNVTNMPVYQNTTTEYFPLGEHYYTKLLEQLEKAQHFIFLEFFILTEGKMLNSIIEILKKKVQQGVDVRIMYDDLGSIYVLRNNYPSYLEKFRNQVCCF